MTQQNKEKNRDVEANNELGVNKQDTSNNRKTITHNTPAEAIANATLQHRVSMLLHCRDPAKPTPPQLAP